MYKRRALGLSGSTDCNHSVDWRILAMFHTPRCLVALCFVLRWSATAAARLSSTATQLEPIEQEINPSFADVDSYHTCKLSEGNYTMSNLSEIQCDSGKTLKDIIEMNPNSSNKLVVAPGKPVRLVGKGRWQTMLEFDISLSPGASLCLEALNIQGKIEILQDETSIDQSKMSYLTFVNCIVNPPEPDAKQLALAELELDGGIQDPLAWRGWLMLRDAALTLQIHDSSLYGGAFVKQSPTFYLSASKSYFYFEGRGFQLVNVTSHIQLEEVKVWAHWNPATGHPSFQMLSGRPEVHVAGSTFYGSAIEMQRSVDLILDVSNTQFKYGRSAIAVTGYEGHGSQVDLRQFRIWCPSLRFSEIFMFVVSPTTVQMDVRLRFWSRVLTVMSMWAPKTWKSRTQRRVYFLWGPVVRPMGCPFRAVQWPWSVGNVLLCHLKTSS